jgi:hypothetical protein
VSISRPHAHGRARVLYDCFTIAQPLRLHLPTKTISGDAATQEETADLGEEAKHYLTEAEWPLAIEPMSDVVYPIVDKKRRTASPSKPGDEEKGVLVGLLSTAIYWRSMIKVIGIYWRSLLSSPIDDHIA